MRKNRAHRWIVTVLSLIVAGSFAAMIALALGGCFGEDPAAVPQENSDGDLVPDPDNGNAAGAATVARTASLDPNPVPTAAHASLTAAAAGAAGYDRGKALAYVRWYARTPNPETAYCSGLGHDGLRPVRIGEDCTNFASQVLWYGGLSMDYTRNPEDGWWYVDSCADRGSSKSWRQVNRLVSYLVSESRLGEFRQRARDLQVGDLIFYRLRREEDGYRCDTGNLFNHTTVVSGFDDRGEPLVSYHSNEAEDVPWDVKNGSPKALGEACAVGFVHIKD